jgi:hypothetical protein
MSDATIGALERNVKLAIAEFRLDRSSVIRGLEFISVPRRKEFAEAMLIPEVLKRCIEVARERATLDLADASPPDNIEESLPENEGLSRGLCAILATMVIIGAILATPESTSENLIAVLKNLTLLPAGLDDTICERVERMCQIKRELYPDLQVPVSIRGGLNFAECRNRIVDRLNPHLLNALQTENRLPNIEPSDALALIDEYIRENRPPIDQRGIEYWRERSGPVIERQTESRTWPSVEPLVPRSLAPSRPVTPDPCTPPQGPRSGPGD